MNYTDVFGEPTRGKYVIAGINVGMILRKDWTTHQQARDYLCDFDGEPQIVEGIDDEFIREKHKEYPHLSLADCEYMWTGAHFCEELLKFDGFMLHASAVVYKERAYLFSAPSGTGKSTHTKQWLDAFGEDAYILNDDKPVIRLLNGKAVVFGTPWSGKTDQNRNAGVLLGGICFLERADENWIKPVGAKDAAFGILNQTIRPGDKKRLVKLLELLDNVIKTTGVFRMGCTISTDAAIMSYDAMKGETRA
ncbi:MAG: hypothetical protein IJE62_06815 [Clostridia bacterium]|nr:hypothetical protein [Clostridia bacterium]